MPSAIRKQVRRSPHWLLFVVGFVVSSGGTLAWAWEKSAALRRLLGLEGPALQKVQDDSAEQDRQRRQMPVAELAPVPVPGGLPLLGDEGEDEYGRPTQYVDGAALRSLLLHKEYAKLNAIFERLQNDFERDGRKEYWPIDAADAFDSAEPALKEQLDGWVAATPNAWAPYLARGVHLTDVAWARRGAKWAKDTPESSFSAMAATLPLALADVERALTIAPKSVAAYRAQIKIMLGQSRKKAARTAMDKATAVCPTCFQVRVAYIMHLLPRWGGSHHEMASFAGGVDGSDRKLGLLRGYVDWDLAQTLRQDEDFEGALRAINRACFFGTHWEFLLERSTINWHLDRNEAALADAESAWRARPGEPEVRRYRIAANEALSRWEPAGNDLLALLRTRPTNEFARSQLPKIVKGLIRRLGAPQGRSPRRRTSSIRAGI